MADARILMVQEEGGGAGGLEECLAGMGYAVCGAAASGQQAAEDAGELRPDLLLMDFGTPGADAAAEAAGRLDVPVVWLTDDPEESLRQGAGTARASGWVLRPFDPRQLRLNIETALSLHAKGKEQRAAAAGQEETIAELKGRLRLMEAVLDSMNEGVIIADETADYLYCNASVDRIARQSVPVLKLDQWAEGYGLFQLDKETHYPNDELPLARALRGQDTDDVEIFMRNPATPDGIYISATGRALHPDSHGMKAAVVVFRDITRLKETESRLTETIAQQQEHSQLMKAVIDSLSDGVMAADDTGRLLLASANVEQVVGTFMPGVGIAGWAEQCNVFCLDQETPFPVEQMPLIRAIAGESVDDVEMFARNEKIPDGMYISVSGRPMRSVANRVTGGVITCRDVTAQKKAAAELQQTIQELHEKSELMEATFNSISDGVVVVDDQCRFLYVNPSAGQIVGMGLTEVPYQQWSEYYGTFFPDRQTPMKAEDLPLVRAVFSGESTDDEDLFIRNGQRPNGVYIRVSTRPLRHDNGEIRGGVSIFRDVTERVFAEEALRRAFAQGRLEVVDTVLHNIGNAINSVTTGIETVHHNVTRDHLVRRLSALAGAIEARQGDWTDYIRNDPQGRKVMPFIIALAQDFSAQNKGLARTVERVRDQAAHIAEIILSQRTYGHQAPGRKDINLRESLWNAVKVLQDSLDKRGIAVEVDCGDAPQEIRIQESPFHQMLVNLIKNAVEAIDKLAADHGLAEPPRIRIRTRLGGDFLNLEVTDNGIGLEETNSRRLFSPGYTTKESGSGLGLHSAANFVIGAGGRIQPSSKGFGKGTTMRVMLRLSSISPPPPPTKMASGPGRATALART